jgi:hypothetical protein
MPASVCVLGTVQGNVDTVPYHTQRLLKSAALGPISSPRHFPDRRDQLSVRVQFFPPSSPRKQGEEPGVAQPRATLRRYRQAVLKTTKTTWLDGLEKRPATSADHTNPAENYS